MTPDDMPDQWYETYERGRPGYPEALFDLFDLAPTATVLDLAAGTGKLTRQLVPRFGRVIAVEPDGGMRGVLGTVCPEAEALDGSADRLPVGNDSIDAIFVAQAFHWFDNDATLVEFARVLRPSGAVIVIWNVADGLVAPDISAAQELLAPIWPENFGFPLDMMSGDWGPTWGQSPLARATFGEIHTVELPNPQRVDREGLVAFFGSMGWIANLPMTERDWLLKALGAKLTADDYSLPWRTRVEWTRVARQM